jgi:hypothetical protein
MIKGKTAWIGWGLRIGTNQSGFLGGFLYLSDAESVNFHCVPNQVLCQVIHRVLRIDTLGATRSYDDSDRVTFLLFNRFKY